MKKIISMMIISLFLSVSTISIASAEETLTGDIDVEVSEWLGIVYPEINIGNQSIELDVEISEVEEVTEYLVNDTIIINLDVTNNSPRKIFVLPRSMFYSAIMTRDLSSVKILPLFPLRELFSRFFPIFHFFKAVNVVDGMLGKNETNTIEIPVSYKIDEETYNNGENATLTLSVMGFLPGDLNGLGEDLPIISKEKISLEISYS